ncbi:hypothetical protein OV208_40205 [Corallococcus sp. bb12-1]|uniref:hypothetical protein n=1 Tax=Corallococcus sp. bb12-1 TaxID=2996784 RepID=UPI00226EE1BA|nr:hypothetical protein [Corallococcus sp. bb12-1]MCY1047591.1 hypothetical protein [Corallococcus sp. bb12-1]
MSSVLKGEWSGVLSDAEGFQARATLVLDGDTSIQGTVSYTLIGTHEPGPEQRGTVQGKSAGDQVQLELKLEGRGAVQFRGEVAKVKHHARAALLGTYHVAGTQDEPVSAGVAIFWQYASENRGG